MEESAWSSKSRTFKVSGNIPSRQGKKTWNQVIKSNLKKTKVMKIIVKNRNVWKSFIRNNLTIASMENRFESRGSNPTRANFLYRIEKP